MRDILTVTLNPAVDMSTETASVRPGPKLRCNAPLRDPGGGGINVSRAIRILGGQSRAMVALGGHNGQMLQNLLTDEGIATIPFAAPGETRTNLAVTEHGTDRQFRFVMPGPDWPVSSCDQLLKTLPGLVSDTGLLVLSGSLAPGMPTDLIRQIVAALGHRDTQVICDISGDPLADLADHPETGLHILRMDQGEAEQLAGAALPERRDSARFARTLVDRGVAEIVIIARGADGSVLSSSQTCLHATAVDVPVNSKVGAGDSFIGAFVLAMALEQDLGVALQRATAAASSAVMTPATRLCTREDTERFLLECRLSVLEI